MIDCEKAADLIPLYIDGELSADERSRLEDHLSSCETCGLLYEEIRELVTALHSIKDEEPPEGFHRAFMDRLAHETKPKNKPWNFMRISMAAACAAVVLIVISALSVGMNTLTGNGNGQALKGAAQLSQAGTGVEAPDYAVGAGDSNQTYQFSGFSLDSGNAADGNAAPETAAAAVGQNTATADPSATSVVTYNISLTVDDVQKTMDKISQLNGVQVSMNYSSPAYEGAQSSASITRRVSVQDYDNLKNQLRLLGDVTDESESMQSMARQLNDLKAQLTARDDQKSRLLTLLGKSGDLDTMVKVEGMLNSASDDSDSLNAQIRDINAQIGQPYINIQLYNRVYAPPAPPNPTLGVRVANSFKQSVNGTVQFMQGLLMFIVRASIPVLSFVIIIVLIYALVRFARKRGGRGPSE